MQIKDLKAILSVSLHVISGQKGRKTATPLLVQNFKQNFSHTHCLACTQLLVAIKFYEEVFLCIAMSSIQFKNNKEGT